jgi:chloramphenicol 3-O phosphotransferase
MSNASTRGPGAGRPVASKLPSVILLNGTSSAGKSSLTGALQARLSFIRMGIDDFIHQRAPVSWYGAPEGLFRAPREGGCAVLEYGPEALKLWRAYHRSVRVCVEEGLGVVVDDAIITRELLEDWVATLAGVDVFFVGVHCAAEELILRELARRDRDLGSAVANVERVHAHAIYDLEIDSTVTPSSALAEQIISALDLRSRPSAFERLRTALT